MQLFVFESARISITDSRIQQSRSFEYNYLHSKVSEFYIRLVVIKNFGIPKSNTLDLENDCSRKIIFPYPVTGNLCMEKYFVFWKQFSQVKLCDRTGIPPTRPDGPNQPKRPDHIATTDVTRPTRSNRRTGHTQMNKSTRSALSDPTRPARHDQRDPTDPIVLTVRTEPNDSTE